MAHTRDDVIGEETIHTLGVPVLACCMKEFDDRHVVTND